jgi:hypothetical protein
LEQIEEKHFFLWRSNLRDLAELVWKYPDYNSFKTEENCLVFNWNKCKSFDEVLFETNKINTPFSVIGDAKYPPLMNKMIKEFFLIYNVKNFIGPEAMELFKENDKLIFMINTPKDYNTIRLLAHKVIYYGSNIQVIFLCSNMSFIPPDTIKEDCIEDFDIIIDNTRKFLPYHEQKLYRCDIICLKESRRNMKLKLKNKKGE